MNHRNQLEIGLNSKEKSMLVMLGIEDDPLICVRSQETKGC